MTDSVDDLLTIREVCSFFGGTKPLDQSTIYRWVRQGRLPKAIRVGPLILRWRRSEIQQALDTMAATSRGQK